MPARLALRLSYGQATSLQGSQPACERLARHVRIPNREILDHDQTPNAMLTDSSQNVILGLDAIPDILLLIEVTMDNSLVAIVEKDAEYGLRRAFIVGAVESQCRTRKSLISCFRFLPKNGDGLGHLLFLPTFQVRNAGRPAPPKQTGRAPAFHLTAG